MATIKENLSELMKSSMKSGDKETLGFVRTLHAAIRKKEIDDRIDLDDAGVQKIIQTALKQRQDSIDQFRAGNRMDLVEKEEKEASFLKRYLPEQMGEAEIRALVTEAISATGAASPKDMGKVMGYLMPKTTGKADGKLVNQIVKELLPQG